MAYKRVDDTIVYYGFHGRAKYDLHKEAERFGYVVAQERYKQNLTQSQLAEKSSVSTSLIGAIENGTKLVDSNSVEKVVNALGYKFEAKLTLGLKKIEEEPKQ